MKKGDFTAFRLITLMLALSGVACGPQQPVSIPTLVELPTLTETPIPSVTPSSTPPPTGTDTPSAPTATISPTFPTATPTVTPTPSRTDPPTPTLTPSQTITDTVTPTLTPTFTASPDIGAFGPLVDLAARVTVLPLETRYSPPTLTALAAARAQIASQTPPGAVIVINAGPGLQLATLPPGAVMPMPPGQIIGPPLGAQSTPLPPLIICQYPAPGGLPTLLATDAALANSLGCPLGAPPAISEVLAASQVFERGTMIYVASASGGIGSIYVLTPDNRFRRFDDPFVPGVDPESGGESVPPGLLEPVRGFGEVWRTNLDVRGSLGYALAAEQGDRARVTDFNRGRAVYVPARGVTYILIEDFPGSGVGAWRALMGGY